MRLFLVCTVVACLSSQPGTRANPPQNQESQVTQQQPTTNLNGIDHLVLSGFMPSQQANQKPGDSHRDSNDSRPNWWMVVLTAIYCVVVAAQLIVLGVQARRLGDTVAKMDEIARCQGTDMHSYIEQATRSASAMEKVAEAMTLTAQTNRQISELTRERWSQQMRAYITVLIGNASYQEREKNTRFSALPRMKNCGVTPAYNVSYRIKAAILQHPVADDFEFPSLPKDQLGGCFLGQQQEMIMLGMVDDFVADQDIVGIKHLTSGRGLYVWGKVTYNDIFAETHQTSFCQEILWLPDGNVFGIYIAGRNQAD